MIHNYETVDYELYNLSTDISETTNLLPTSDQLVVDLANDMITDMRSHLITTSAPLPTYRSGVDAGNEVPLPDFISLSSSGNSGDGCQVTAGYEAYWDFDTFNNADDASGNSHDPIAITGSLTYDGLDFQEGDQSVVFNGSTEIQYSSGSFLTTSTASRTVMAWIKPTTLSGAQEIFEEGGSGNGLALRLNGTNLEASLSNNQSGNTDPNHTVSTAYPNDGAWHHVALVFDGSSSSLALYIDGVLANSTVGSYSSIGTHSSPGGIGGVINGDAFGAGGGTGFFTGKMDAIAIYDAVLNSTEVEDSACIPTLSILDEELNGVKIYPNPVTYDLNISLNESAKNIAIELFDILGKSIIKKNFANRNMISIPIDNLSDGLYLAKISMDNHTVIKKILKK